MSNSVVIRPVAVWTGAVAVAVASALTSAQSASPAPSADDLQTVTITAIVDAASRRQKWIDQAQSLNIYMAGASGKKLDELYKHAWLRGLKTTYYLRTSSATQAEKSTVQSGSHNAVSSSQGTGMSAMEAAAAAARAQMSDVPATDIKFCGVDDPTCEACQ